MWRGDRAWRAPTGTPGTSHVASASWPTPTAPRRTAATSRKRCSRPSQASTSWSNLAQPDKKIVVGDDLAFPDEPLATLLHRRFRAGVAAVAFGGTHPAMEQEHEGVLFFNPGSPNLPVEGSPAAVAALDLGAGAPRVEIVTIEP